MTTKSICPKSLCGTVMRIRIVAYLSCGFGRGVRPMRFRQLMSFAVALLVCGGVAGVRAQAPASAGQTAAQSGGVEKNPPIEERPDPLKHRLSDSQERRRRSAL